MSWLTNSYKSSTIFAITMWVLLTGGSAVGQVTQRWVERYNGPGNNSDNARAIAINSNTGNIYVTGDSAGAGNVLDYGTVAYNPSGTQLWVARYAPGQSTSIAVDSASGNVYVTGLSGNKPATVAYNSSGQQLWVAIPTGIVSGTGTAVTVDPTTGNVYVVAGILVGPCCSYKTAMLTIAYNRSGQQLWAVQYVQSDATFRAIAVDSSRGRVYIGGYALFSDVDPPYGSANYVTFAYDTTTGQQVWMARHVSSDIGEATSIAIDHSSGSVYLTGSDSPRFDDNGNISFETISYSVTGTEQWVRDYVALPVADEDSSTPFEGIAVDQNSGRVYVTGTSFGTSLDYSTVAYDASGTQLWAKSYDGAGATDHARAIAVDPKSGNVYVTGDSQNSIIYYATVAYGSSGNQLWVQTYNGPSTAGSFAHAIGVDNSSNVYVTGSSAGTPATGTDFATVKYSQP